jgi:putative photosynthetic complex assembly protein 2
MDEGAVGFKRFEQALMVMLHHELALLLNFAVLCVMQIGQANHIALCTFALLWCMRVSAKLNLFFGVTENGAAYLPAHLSYLASYFRHRRMTWWFAISVSLSVAVWVWLIWQSLTGAVEMTTAWVMLASLLSLAIVEHALMIFPLPLQRLWGWAMSRTAPSA